MSVPKLRFKEFGDEWEEKILGDITSKITDGTHDTPKPVQEGVPYLTAIHIKDGFIDYENCYYLSEEDHNKIYKRCNPEKGDLLIVNIGAGTATCAINTIAYEFSLKNVALIKPDKFKVFPEYLLQVQRKNSLKQFNQLTAGGAQPFLSLSEIGKFKVSFPSLPEQAKIANFLTAVDDKIAQLTQKGKLLTQYKKGVMQKIFSQELRFKYDDGLEFDEWDFIELEKIAFKVNDKNKDFSISNVLTNSATQGIVNQTDYFDRDIANQNNLGGYYIVKIDDFVYNPRISNNALVGSLKRNNLVKGVMSPLYTVFRFENVNLSFFEQYFETTHWHDYMKSIANSGARHDRLNITNTDFFNLPVPLPSVAEQTKIANFLTALDDKINQNLAHLNAVKQYKKGLLQQMFV